MKDKLISFTSERTQVDHKKDEKNFFFLTTINAPELDEDAGDTRQPVDISCVIDRSGSMSGDRIKLTRETLKFLVQEMKDQDRIGIVLFDSAVEVYQPLTYCNENNRAMLVQKINQIDTRGSTNLSGGLFKGMELLRERTTRNPISSCLLFTDGQANQGYRDFPSIMSMLRGELPGHGSGGGGGGRRSRGMPFGRRRHQVQQQSRRVPQMQMQMQMPVQQQQQQMPLPPGPVAPPKEKKKMPESKKVGPNFLEDGVSIYTFGFGSGHNEALLKGIADATHGIYYFIETIEDIAESFVDCLGGLMSVVAKDISIRIMPQNGVSIEKIHTIYRKSEGEGGSTVIHLPDLQSEEKRDILFTASLPAIPHAELKWEAVGVEVEYTDKEEKKQKEVCMGIVMRVEEEPESQEINEKLDEQRNRVLASDVLEKARHLADNGKFNEAQDIVKETSLKIQSSKSGKSPFCQALYKDMNEQGGRLNRSAYHGGGRKKMMCQSMGLQKQRVADVKSASNSLFQNKKRMKMKSKFRSNY